MPVSSWQDRLGPVLRGPSGRAEDLERSVPLAGPAMNMRRMNSGLTTTAAGAVPAWAMALLLSIPIRRGDRRSRLERRPGKQDSRIGRQDHRDDALLT